MSAVIFGEIAALGAAFCWAVSPILYRQALFKSKPVSANIVRCATNAAVMVILLFAFGWWSAAANLPMGVVAIVIISGVFGLGLGDTLYLYGLKSAGVSVAVPLAATYPLFSLIWTTALLGQPLTATIVAGASIILIGIWLLSRERTGGAALVKGRVALTGAVVSLAAAVAWSVSVTLMGVAVKMPGVNSIEANYAIVTVRIVALAVLFMMFAPLIDRNRGFLKLKRRTVIELTLGGLVANALGWLLMNYSFLNIPQAQAIPISSITPLFSALAGFLLFREKATINRVLGAIIIVVGVILIFIV
ncbi:MAG TPA: DMT family transporter [Candidatus Nanoarchaeia archaeon]|nr:DMT family transporter [Candidatus Nanoarchaeia archaeon]